MLEKAEYTEVLAQFEKHLIREEKSEATIGKYLHDIRCFFSFLDGRPITKDETLAYKLYLTEHYATASVNSMLVSLNVFLRFIGNGDAQVKTLKIQRQIFCREEKELTQAEYKRLLAAAKGTRLFYVIQTICGTGIRVSELAYITAEAVRCGKAVVNCKNKTRVIFIPVYLQKLLKEYMKKSGVKTGTVFVSKNGKPLDRSNIWRDMKALCKLAGVAEGKVFPHNLRHLFARTFYKIEKDIVRLADLLGHSSINTTRIYTTESGSEHILCLERMHRRLVT